MNRTAQSYYRDERGRFTKPAIASLLPLATLVMGIAWGGVMFGFAMRDAERRRWREWQCEQQGAELVGSECIVWSGEHVERDGLSIPVRRASWRVPEPPGGDSLR